MKISKNWLNDYIFSQKSDIDLVNAFTQLGLECSSEKNNSIDSNIVIGKVLECKKHPNADRLKVCKIDVCDIDPLVIVCGAPNVKQNIFVPVAKIGSKIGKFKIKKTKIRDVISNGMICSEKELGLGDDHDGIMILDDSFKIGETLTSALNINEDTIFDFDMTPNRGDCFSHLGIARELGIIENSKLKDDTIKFKKGKFKTSDFINVSVKDYSLCPRYACRIIKNIKVQESPQWLKNKLNSIGQKSINNVVDLANYIMFDMGQPLHTFDYNKLNGKMIEVRAAKKNEEIICLNNEVKKLSTDDIVIADKEGPVAIAGVIGGLHSQVQNDTLDILLESAVFNEVNIRKTSKKYDYAKEASKRFERGIDFKNVINAMDKFTKILLEISGGDSSIDYIDIYTKRNDKEILFDVLKCNSFLGTSLNSKEIKNIFNFLNINCSKGEHSFKCLIPSYRNDLVREVDLFEEVARVYGYDKIPSELNFKFSSNSLIADHNIIEDKIRTILSNNGFNEHYSNSLYSEEETLLSDNPAVELLNPLSIDMKYLRNSLVPGILKTLSYNEKRENSFLKYYEIGSINIFSEKKYNLSIENRMLCLGYLGNSIKSWNGPKSFNIFDVKADISMIFHNLGLGEINFKVQEKSNNDNYKISILFNKKIIGEIISLDHKARKKHNILNQVIICNFYLFEVNQIYNKIKISYKKIVSYPSINRDIAILVDSVIDHEKISNIIFNTGSDLLKEVTLFDVYDNKDLEKNTKSMAYSLKFQSASRTLKADEIDKEMKLILKELSSKIRAKQR